MNAPDLTIFSKHSVGKRIAANTGLMLGSKTLSVLLGLGSLIIAAKSLSIVALGIILFLHAYHLFFAELATFQAWQTIIRFGMDDVKDEDASSLSRLLKFGCKLDILSAFAAFLLAIACFSIVVLIGETFPDFFQRDGQFIDVRELQTLVILYCSLLLFRHRGTSIGVFRLFDRFDVLALHGVVMPAVRFIGVLIAAYLGADMKGFLLAWFIGSLADYILLPILAARELKLRHLLRPVFKAKSKIFKQRRGVWPFVIKANLDATLAASNVHLPVLLVMGVFGAGWVTIYRTAEEVAKLLSEGFKLLDQVIYPELAKMVSIDEAPKIWKLVIKTAIILLVIGLAASLVLLFFLGGLLGLFLPEEYVEAAPLASLLVPAAALLGMAAPLYPVLYATDHPERAIYARGAGVLVYILSFFVLSFTIGRMAPGWAAIAGNLVAVGLLLLLAKQALDKVVIRENMDVNGANQVGPSFSLIGDSEARIWGLPVREWQKRTFKKAGADIDRVVGLDDQGIYHHIDWIMSAELTKSFTKTTRTALISNGTIVSLSGANRNEAKMFIGQSESNLSKTNFITVEPSDINDGYIKSLRKSEPPYVLNIYETPILDIMRKQFNSSYKGITDFVTKWFWPIPAFYITRLCAHLRMTPNQVTTIGLVLMLAATYFFWNGAWALGFLCGWTMTFLDTVDGKLARTTMTYSNWGNVYDHGIDLVHPPFWYWAWFIGLGGESYQLSEPLFFALLSIWIGYIVDRVIEGIFLGQHGFHIHVWMRFNSGLRFFIARRNPNTFIMMIGIILTLFWAGAGEWAFFLVAIWTWVCIGVNFVTLIASYIVKKPIVSWMNS